MHKSGASIIIRGMRAAIAFFVALLLPLQSLYAVSLMPCALAVTVSHASVSHDAQDPILKSDQSAHVHITQTLNANALTFVDSVKSYSAPSCPEHDAHSSDGCCHLVISLPAHSDVLSQVPVSSALRMASGMSPLHFTTSGPFRPPRVWVA